MPFSNEAFLKMVTYFSKMLYPQPEEPMTSEEWQVSTNLSRMMLWTGQGWNGTGTAAEPMIATGRQLRLIACAAWQVSRNPNPSLLADIRLAERVADGKTLGSTAKSSSVLFPDPYDAFEAIRNATFMTSEGSATESELCGVILEIIGNPFDLAVLDQKWLFPYKVHNLARGIYERSWWNGVEIKVLADMLEDNGCGEQRILSHLRQPNYRHWKGCWAIDLILNQR